MILRLIKERLLSTKRAGAGFFILGLLTIIFVLVAVDFTYRRNLIQYNYEKLDDAITNSLLSGAIINRREYGQGGSLVIQEGETATTGDTYVINAARLFRDTIKYNLGIDENYNITRYAGMEGTLMIDEFRVYNYFTYSDGNFRIVEYALTKDGTNITEYAMNEQVLVTTTDGVHEISETSLYADISVTLKLMGFSKVYCAFDESATRRQVHIKRLVSVVE